RLLGSIGLLHLTTRREHHHGQQQGDRGANPTQRAHRAPSPAGSVTPPRSPAGSAGPAAVDTNTFEVSKFSDGPSLRCAPSSRKALIQYQARAIEMMRNGSDPHIAAICNPSRPPASSIA